jgi:hypothetical protein
MGGELAKIRYMLVMARIPLRSFPFPRISKFTGEQASTLDDVPRTPLVQRLLWRPVEYACVFVVDSIVAAPLQFSAVWPSDLATLAVLAMDKYSPIYMVVSGHWKIASENITIAYL